jgi:glucose/arabinose dehydrogenase
MRLSRIRPLLAVAALSCLVTLTACGGGASGSTPTWVPQPDFQGNTDPQPQLPGNGLPAPLPSGVNPNTPGPSGSNGSPSTGPSGSPTASADPAVVATHLDQPTGLVVLPDGTALVGERRTGRVLRVQPVAGKPVQTVATLTGLDATGDGGLLDLAVSRTFDQDGLVYAYLTTPTDNRVVHFALGKPPTPVLTGIPKGSTGNVGRLAFDGTGALLVGTGDAGQPALAAQPSSLAGKVLRISDIGQPAEGNPMPGSAVFASGFQSVDGLCVDRTTGLRVAVARTTSATGTSVQVDIVQAGRDFGWPTRGPGSTPPATTLPAASGGGAGCTVAAGHLVIATTDGQSLLSASLSSSGTVGVFGTALRNRYGRLRTVVAGSDGALWITTSNRDGHGRPTPTDDRVIRLTGSDGGSGSVL